MLILFRYGEPTRYGQQQPLDPRYGQIQQQQQPESYDTYIH